MAFSDGALIRFGYRGKAGAFPLKEGICSGHFSAPAFQQAFCRRPNSRALHGAGPRPAQGGVEIARLLFLADKIPKRRMKPSQAILGSYHITSTRVGLQPAHEPQLDTLRLPREQRRPMARSRGMHHELLLIDQSPLRERQSTVNRRFVVAVRATLASTRSSSNFVVLLYRRPQKTSEGTAAANLFRSRKALRSCIESADLSDHLKVSGDNNRRASVQSAPVALW